MLDNAHDFLPIISSIPGPRGQAGAAGAAGTAGTPGKNAFTTTNANFIMPATGATVTVVVVDTAWVALGQTVYIETAGYFTVTAIPTSLTLTLRAQAVAENATEGATIGFPKKVTPGGFAEADTGLLDDIDGRVTALENAGGGMKTFISATAPTNPGSNLQVGDVWFQTAVSSTTVLAQWRWDGTGWVKVSVQITAGDFGLGVRPIVKVDALPPSGAVGEFVLLTTDKKLYRGTGTGWTKAVETADLTGDINGEIITNGTILAPKIAANQISSDHVGANQIITQAANIATAVINDAHIANLSATKLTAGDISSVNIGYGGRIFHPSFPTKKFRSVAFGAAVPAEKTFVSGNCLSAGYAHANGVTAYGPGHVGWTADGMTACADSDGTIRAQIQGRLIGYNGAVLAYVQKNGGTPYTLAAIGSNDGGNAYIDCTRMLTGYAPTDMVKFFIAPADGDGVVVVATCRVELDVTIFNW